MFGPAGKCTLLENGTGGYGQCFFQIHFSACSHHPSPSLGTGSWKSQQYNVHDATMD